MTQRIIAIDWSGAATHAGRTIWLAEVDPASGAVVRLESGRDRPGIAEYLIDESRRTPDVVVGMDFAFSLPAWFLEQRELPDAPALWALVEREGERWLAACEAPFWGRPGRKRPDLVDHLRHADREVPPVGGISPKSVFQIGGAGAVGTGSLRGMPILRRLRDAGFAVWPFDRPQRPLVVEIYPRALTGPVVKSSEPARRRYLEDRHRNLEPHIRELAIASEDAFDALVSALVMAEHAADFDALNPGDDDRRRREGQIWVPAAARTPEPGDVSERVGTPERPRRPFDSSKTRVGPIFRALRACEDDDPAWPARLLALAADETQSAGDGRPWTSQDLTVLEGHFEPAERGLQPPVALLSWLVRNFPAPASRIRGDGETAELRRRLGAGDPETVERALGRLRSAGAASGWHVLEGPTYPDALIVTRDALVVVEGKRTESGLTTDTTWMAGRDQMLRHLDAAWEIRGRRAVYGVLIVEGDQPSGALPERWRVAAESITTTESVVSSLPHRGEDERRGIAAAFVGATTWQRIASEFGVDAVLNDGRAIDVHA